MSAFMLILAIMGILGLVSALTLSGLILHFYPDGSSYQRALRSLRFKQLSVLSCLFCLAMAASYALIHNPWAILYLLIACKLATWWFRLMVIQHM